VDTPKLEKHLENNTGEYFPGLGEGKSSSIREISTNHKRTTLKLRTPAYQNIAFKEWKQKARPEKIFATCKGLVGSSTRNVQVLTPATCACNLTRK